MIVTIRVCVFTVDFSNVKFFTTLFFNIAFASLLKEMPF